MFILTLKIFVLVSCTVKNKALADDEPKVEEYEKLINDGIINAIKYELPSNGKMYEANNDTIADYGSYDFIIIGGGTTGSVIASRLSEIKNVTVLLIEAGNFTDNHFIQFTRFFMLHAFSEYSWGYKSVPQTTACLGTVNQICQIYRGKGVGGTSLINGAVYSRGSPSNFDSWAKMVKDDSWSYKNVLKYFKKSENFHWTNPKAPTNLKYHGKYGLLQVQNRLPNDYLNQVFLEANKELGYNITDYNGPNQIGASFLQFYTNNGTREDLGTAFVTPFLNRSNLKVLTSSYVTKIEINKKTKVAESVIFTQFGKIFTAKANKEVILSAGAISSPQILMLSGIGPRNHLQEIGIPIIKNLEVGTRLVDHPASRTLVFSTNYTVETVPLKEQIKDYLKGKGELSAPTISQAVGFYKIVNKNVPDLEIISDLVKPSAIEQKYAGWKNETYQGFYEKNKTLIAFLIANVAPKSLGSVKLKSKNPFDFPEIDPRLLSDYKNEDIELMYKGIQFIFKLIETSPYKKLNLKYSGRPLPTCRAHKFKSKSYWYCYLRQVTLTAYHPVGTCPMGTDKQKYAVVDSKLKVLGVKGLRIADASIFPAPLAAHPSIPCVMIGEKISDHIKSEYYNNYQG